MSDDEDDVEVMAANAEILQSPDGNVVLNSNCQAPGSGGSESRMSIGTPAESTRAQSSLSTTARAAKPKRIMVRKGVRASVKRKHMKTSVDIASPAWDCIKDLHDDYKLYGTITGKAVGSCFPIMFDILPHGHQDYMIPRKSINPLTKGADEPEYDHVEAEEERIADELGMVPDTDSEEECGGDDAGAATSTKKKKKKVNHAKESEAKFLKLDVKQREVAKSFQHFYGPGENDFIAWTILADTEQIVEDAMVHPIPDSTPMKVNIPWSNEREKMAFNDIFFGYFFPSLGGKAKLMDELLWDERSGMLATMKKDNIKFECSDGDPEKIVKICITLMIAASNEVYSGMNMLWLSGRGYGLKDYPNYKQYLPKNYFKAFIRAFPFIWADKKYWFMSRNDLPWDVMDGFVKEYNAMRTSLTDVHYAVLDESMSGWRPKTTANGGLPNITFEPRKPVNLGTMIRNGCECRSGIMVHHDIVKGTVQQSNKKYNRDLSHLPKNEPIQAHVAEVLRQAEGANVVKGGWIGGDAWFGSVNSCVELMTRLGIHSTFIIKTNKNYCPVEVIRSVLLARFGTRPGGHWATMKATISGVDMFLTAYAWSQKGIAFILSTCGTTVRHENDYVAKHQDGYGNVDSRLLARPAIASFLYEFLPLIDEHNKARQSSLALELKWPTQCCWFRLFTTFIGMAVVDVQRWDRNMRKRIPQIPDCDFFYDLERFEDIDNIGSVLLYADLISKKLMDPTMRYREGRQPTPRLGKHNNPDVTPPVVRYMKNGKLANEKGKAYQRFCYICRTYGDNHNTQWACRECNMPLCNYNVDRRGEGEWACLMEHKQSTDNYDGCGHQRESFIVPDSHLKPGLKRGRCRKRVIRESSDDNNDDGRKDGSNDSSDDGSDDNNDNGRKDHGSNDGTENNFIAYRLRTRK